MLKRTSTFILLFVIFMFVTKAFAEFYVIPVGSRTVDPDDVVQLYTVSFPGALSEFKRMRANGVLTSTAFTVPEGKVFVLTSVLNHPCVLNDGNVQIQLWQGSNARET